MPFTLLIAIWKAIIIPNYLASWCKLFPSSI